MVSANIFAVLRAGTQPAVTGRMQKRLAILLLVLTGCAGSVDSPSGDEEGFTMVTKRPPIVVIPTHRPEQLGGMPLEYEGRQRLYVGERGGLLRSIDWDPARGRGGERIIRTFPDLQAMTTFDDYQGHHRILFVDGAGDVHHVVQDDKGIDEDYLLGRIDDVVVSLAAYSPTDDLYAHAFALHPNGTIDEIVFVGQGPAAAINYNIASFGPSSALSAVFNPADGAHLLVLNQYGIYDVHVPRYWNRPSQPPFTTDYRGKVAGATALASYRGNDGWSHTAVADPAGAVHHLSFLDTASPANVWSPNTLGTVPAPVTALTAYEMSPLHNVVVAMDKNGNLNKIDGSVAQVIHYNPWSGEPDWIAPQLVGYPAVQIESKVCLTDAARAQMQSFIAGKLAGIGNASAQAYFKNARFYSQCVGTQEHGGIFRIDQSQLSRDAALQSQQIINDSDGTLGFKLQGWALRELTGLVWATIPKAQGVATLQGYTLSLDSPGHDTVNLHVNTDLQLLPPFPPVGAGVDYTDHIYIDADANLKCESHWTYPAPDEPHVGCIAAGVFPVQTPGASNKTLLDYKHVIVDGTGIFADAAPGGRTN